MAQLGDLTVCCERRARLQGDVLYCPSCGGIIDHTPDLAKTAEVINLFRRAGLIRDTPSETVEDPPLTLAQRKAINRAREDTLL